MCLSVFLRQTDVKASIAAVLWILLCPGLLSGGAEGGSELTSPHFKLLRNCRELFCFGARV